MEEEVNTRFYPEIEREGQWSLLDAGWSEGGTDADTAAGSIEPASSAGAYTAEQRTEAARLWQELGTESPYFQRFYAGNTPELYNADGTPRVVYHGTAEFIPEFKGEVLGANTSAEDARLGFFFTTSREVAAGYASASLPYELGLINKRYRELVDLYSTEIKGYDEKGRPIYLTAEELEEVEAAYKAAEREAEEKVIPYKRQRDRGTVMGVYLSLKNPYVYDCEGGYYDAELFTKILEEARAAGSDGVIFKNVYDSNNGAKDVLADSIVVFTPEQIKSATDNVGSFDPASRDTRYAIQGAGLEGWQSPARRRRYPLYRPYSEDDRDRWIEQLEARRAKMELERALAGTDIW